jgi:hypothetical protein
MGWCFVVILIWFLGIAIVLYIRVETVRECGSDCDEEACTRRLSSSSRSVSTAKRVPSPASKWASASTPLNKKPPGFRKKLPSSSGYLTASTDYGSSGSQDVFTTADTGFQRIRSIFFSAPTSIRNQKTRHCRLSKCSVWYRTQKLTVASGVNQQGSIMRDSHIDSDGDGCSKYSTPCPTGSPEGGASLASLGSRFSLFSLAEAGASYQAGLRSSACSPSKKASDNAGYDYLESVASSRSRFSMVALAQTGSSNDADIQSLISSQSAKASATAGNDEPEGFFSFSSSFTVVALSEPNSSDEADIQSLTSSQYTEASGKSGKEDLDDDQGSSGDDSAQKTDSWDDYKHSS